MKIRNFIGAAVIALAVMLSPAPTESAPVSAVAGGIRLQVACLENAPDPPEPPKLINESSFNLPSEVVAYMLFRAKCIFDDGHVVIISATRVVR